MRVEKQRKVPARNQETISIVDQLDFLSNLQSHSNRSWCSTPSL